MSTPPMEWSTILVNAVSKPGVLSDAYSRFWNYSTGNQLLALFQCFDRELEPGPINTFVGWMKLGRTVKKGEKAITLCMPVSRTVATKKTVPLDQPAHEADEDNAQAVRIFLYRPHWFVLAQTEGKDYVPTVLPEWTEAQAMKTLEIEHVPFTHPDGNAQGYAVNRCVAVSPIAFCPHRTLFHELAHVVLGHTLEHQNLVDLDETTPRDMREVEAECVALICCESLSLPGTEFSRGYIQHWLSGQIIGDRSAQRIFRAADLILKSGHPGDQHN